MQAYDSFFMNKTYIKNKTFNNYLKKIMLPSKNEINNNHMESKKQKGSFTNYGETVIKEELTEIECSIESVQKQSDAIMCGLFAIAFCVDLCLNIDPTNRHYDEKKMRDHLLKCLNRQSFEEFPQVTEPYQNRISSQHHIIYIEI